MNGLRPMEGTRAMRLATLVLVLITLLTLAGVILAGDLPVVERHVIGAGGGRAEAAPYTQSAILGQAVAGTAGQGSIGLCAGFWCNAAAAATRQHWIYLPLVLRNS